MTDLTIRTATPNDMADVARLCWAYRDLLLDRESGAGLPPMTAAFYPAETYQALIDDLPRIHARPHGDILLADIDGITMGCAMYYPLNDQGVTEIKRVYVDPAARGQRAGRRLIEDAMTRARADGYTRMVLDTMASLTEAIALYERMGFTPCAPYYDEEVAPEFLPHLRCFDHPL
ncbi:GNAT family N-acetyltransferase [Tateyamaria omphalii]|uniref:GNAT family N-acetyltransferase n=1 Tax=Tateyamaria omphalii TaxID=299262 RepID=UPI001C99AB46|nr:GNAT family N-acetyltransferase [Tateyamaria omphalii]MBY5932783.1 GNAT family N-acetyltransferase [Tateyamaria omphalii]